MKAEPIPLELLSQDSQQFESNFVHDVYDTIASHFSATRYKKWPVIENFLASLPFGSIVLDVGCGNGKYAPPLQSSNAHDENINSQTLTTKIHDDAQANETNEKTNGSKNEQDETACTRYPYFHIGLDHSEPLVKLATQTHFMDGIVSDSLTCPIISSFADAVISVAVIHHFSTHERRRDAVKELFRMCRSNGRVLIYVWALEQGQRGTKYAQRRKFDGSSQDVFVPWKLRQSENQDKKDDVTKYRYYHLFAEGELERIVSEAAEMTNVSIIDQQSGYDSDNWYVIVQLSK